jgi:hypothetical protein
LKQILAREWQKTALVKWIANNNRGVVSVATGGGKTIFAFMAFRELSNDSILLVTVPSTTSIVRGSAVGVDTDLMTVEYRCPVPFSFSPMTVKW